MSHLLTIQTSKLRVGDIVHVYAGSMIFANQKITDLDTKIDYIGTVSTDDTKREGFGFIDPTYTFFLVERPKQPLPKSIGSVVEVDGVKYVRVLEDSQWFYEWAKSEDTDQFDSISTEYLADLNYTVV